MTSNTKSLPLVWEYDGKGEWEAPSQVMDPEMTDEPQETWCKEWCLKWRIRVMEDGRFTASDSDDLLIRFNEKMRTPWSRLDVLQGAIDLDESLARSSSFHNCRKPTPVTLLPADKYAK